mgnify:CR=1 FL=1
MNDHMENEGKIKKEDLGFILAQVAFMVFAVIRFYDRAYVVMRNMPLPALKNQHMAAAGTAMYFISILLFSLVSLAYSREEKKKQVAYLLTAASIVMIPAFLPENYFGVIDVYSSVLGFFCLILLHSKYLDKLVGVLIFLMIRWDMTAAVTWGIWLLAFVFYLTYRDRESVREEPSGGKKYALLFTVVLYIIGCVIPHSDSTSYDRFFEPRFEINLTSAVITLIFLLPFAVLYIRLLILLAQSLHRKVAKLSYYCMFFAAFPSFIMWFLKGDYYRGIYYLVAESVLGMLMLVEGERLRGEENPASHKSVWDSSKSMRLFLLLYLAFVMFFFMYGKPLLLEEQLLEY